MNLDPCITRRQFAALAAACAATPSVLAVEKSVGKLRRADSFFGLHFDLHPDETDTALGRDVSEDLVERVLAELEVTRGALRVVAGDALVDDGDHDRPLGRSVSCPRGRRALHPQHHSCLHRRPGDQGH